MEQNNGLNKAIRQFKDYLDKGNQYIEKAAGVYCKAIDEDAKNRYAFQDQCPEVPKNAWKHLEMIGRGLLDVQIMFSGTRCIQTLARLPIDKQKEILANGIDVFDGKRMRHIPVSAVDFNMARQAIAPDGHIRTKDEQAVYLRSYGKKKQTQKTNDYEIHRNKVMFLQNRFYTKKELLKILEQMG